MKKNSPPESQTKSESKVTESLLNEIESLLDIDSVHEDMTKKKILFDGRQYTLKIPKRLADQVGLDHKKHIAVFQVQSFPLDQKKKPRLFIEIERGNNE